MIEVKRLSEFPEELQSAMGVHSLGHARIAEVGEKCDPTDVIGDDAGRRFYVGGVNSTSVLVAFKVGGYAGQSSFTVAYIYDAKWRPIKQWSIGLPTTLDEVREMIRFAVLEPVTAT